MSGAAVRSHFVFSLQEKEGEVDGEDEPEPEESKKSVRAEAPSSPPSSPSYSSTRVKVLRHGGGFERELKSMTISVEEHPADGGYGGLTWGSAVVLASYLFFNPNLVSGKQAVLELGSGTGLVGLMAARLGAEKVFLTDAHDENLVLERLRRSASTNGVDSCCTVLPLTWGEFTESVLSLEPTLILGADVMYDHDLLECDPLFATVYYFLSEAKLKNRRCSFFMTYQDRGMARGGQHLLEKWGMEVFEEVVLSSFMAPSPTLEQCRVQGIHLLRLGIK